MVFFRIHLLLLATFHLSSTALLLGPSFNRMRASRILSRSIRVGPNRFSSLRRPPNYFNDHPRTPTSGIVRFASAVPTPPTMPSMNDANNRDRSEYEIWVRRLYETNMFHPVKMGLQNIQQLHAALGNPLDQTVVVHVAGTNGKGSVALKIAKTLELCNLNVGLFCSPHVSSFRERMQINSQLISEEEVVELLPKIYKICQEQNIPATFFEITTALAFWFFSVRKADVIVLETGLGGRLDATNVVKAPALSIITSIGLEHTRILGDTIELIALEKGGIIKPDRPVLVGPNVPHDVLRQCAAEKGASEYLTCEDVLGPNRGSNNELSRDELLDYDLENARIASAALQLLQKARPDVIGSAPIDEDVIRQGTAVRPPCRFECIDSVPPVILDVAHNPPAMDYLVRKLQRTFPDRTFRMVVGMSADKDLQLCSQSIVQAVGGDASRVHLVQAAHPRAAKVSAILEASGGLLQPLNNASTGSNNKDGSSRQAHYNLDDPSVTTQIQLATKLAKENGETLVICGSVFLMAETREALGFDEPRDSAYIAEMSGAGVRYAQENFNETKN